MLRCFTLTLLTLLTTLLTHLLDPLDPLDRSFTAMSAAHGPDEVPCPLFQLPDELLSHILCFVRLNDVPNVLATSPRLHALRLMFVPELLRR